MGFARAGLSIAFGIAGVGRAMLQAHAVYTLGVWGASHVFGRRSSAAADAPAPTQDGLRVAALVVAHDESRVIGDCVRSLLAQHYPPGRFAVFVVADNCSDSTAELARGAGASVFERNTVRLEGKPAAVAFGVERIGESGQYDAIAVFDADNLVDPGFLSAIAARIAAGELVVQGFVDAKNADDSWVSAFGAIGFWVIDGVVQRPRERLGLSAAMMGTGFAARPALFPVALATPSALADDLEASARLALRGVRVAYEPRARTLDERPTQMDASVAQRKRWMQGRWATVERWLPALAAAALAPGGPKPLAERLRTLDVAFRLVSPSLLFSAAALGTLASGELALRAVTASGGTAAARRAIGLAALYFFLPLPSLARHRPTPRVWAAYLLQPTFLLRSVPISVRGWLARKDLTWVHTQHGGQSDGGMP